MKTHETLGAQAIAQAERIVAQPVALFTLAKEIAHRHHERWDGSGYPGGLQGNQIPLAARIFAVADTWDALAHDRRYHQAWPREKVCAHIKAGAGSHFDPEVVEVFLKMDICRENSVSE